MPVPLASPEVSGFLFTRAFPVPKTPAESPAIGSTQAPVLAASAFRATKSALLGASSPPSVADGSQLSSSPPKKAVLPYPDHSLFPSDPILSPPPRTPPSKRAAMPSPLASEELRTPPSTRTCTPADTHSPAAPAAPGDPPAAYASPVGKASSWHPPSPRE